MGASIGDGNYSFFVTLLVCVVGVVSGDMLWFELGRWRGRSVLKVLCRLSLEPDTCVRQTELNFMKRGPWTLLFTKFVPGIGLISTALAGAIKMPRWQFLLADAGGASLWASAYLLTGVLFHREINKAILFLGLFGRRAGFTLALLLAAFVAWRYFQRVRFRRQLRIDRISPQEAFDLMQSDTPPVMVDLRSPSEIARTGQKILGAQVLRPAQLRAHFADIPRDRGAILYCT
jgi:membrane protein DedA with SNARE-associated domain